MAGLHFRPNHHQSTMISPVAMATAIVMAFAFEGVSDSFAAARSGCDELASGLVGVGGIVVAVWSASPLGVDASSFMEASGGFGFARSRRWSRMIRPMA